MESDSFELQAIASLSLVAFRNYANVELSLDRLPVVLTGPNGSGKTNILEALSLLAPGRGLRRAPLSQVQSRYVRQPWAIAVEHRLNGDSVTIGTGRDPESPDASRRIVRMDGNLVKGQQALADRVAIAWVTPDMDRLLADGPSARRKLLDRLVYSFDSAHAGRAHRYEKALRERMALLREGMADPSWLDALEDTLAQTGVAIAAARLQLVRQLQTGIDDANEAFPQAELSLEGYAEEALTNAPALLVEERMRDALAGARSQDAQSGTCSIGPHRSDLVVLHRARQCPAPMCSTGEQKALVIAIMLAYVRLLGLWQGKAPLFLLDDITAHLDEKRRAALFDAVEKLRVQAWFTGTEEALFTRLRGRAQFFSIHDAEPTMEGAAEKLGRVA